VLRKNKRISTSHNLGATNNGMVAYLEEVPFLKMGRVSTCEATAGTAGETGAEGTRAEGGWAGGDGADDTGANTMQDEATAGTAMGEAAAGMETGEVGAGTVIGGGEREAILTEPAV